MPRRSVSSPLPSRPDLSTILNLHPEEEPWCAGIARTKGRRCQLRTNAMGRQTAVALLGRGTDALHAGRDVHDILCLLAPHVLCTRWHQGQASQLVDKWQGCVQEYRDSLVETDDTRSGWRTHSGETRHERDERRRRREQREQRSLDAVERMLDARFDEFTRFIEEGGSSRSRQAETSRRRHDMNADGAPRGNIAGDISQNRTQLVTQQSTRRAQSEGNVRVGGRNVSFRVSITVEIQPIEGAVETEDEENDDEDDERPDQALGRVAPHHPLNDSARRQTIEGECSICLEPLRPRHTTQSPSNEPGYGEQSNLSWCRAQCGVNFHSRCINEWLAVAVTCPNCRAAWEV